MSSLEKHACFFLDLGNNEFFKMKKLILPIAVVLALIWVVSCSKNNATPPAANEQTAPNAPGSMLITGAGSTLDYPAFTKWFEAYKAVNPNVQFNYQSIGSGAGQKQLLNQTVSFGASTVFTSPTTKSLPMVPCMKL